MCQCMIVMVIREVVSIVIVVALICIDMHHYVVWLKEACFPVHKGETSDLSQAQKGCLELRNGAHGFIRGDPIPENTKC